MGYDKVYLLGADSDWHINLSVDSHNNVYINSTHFYGAEKKYMPYKLSFMMQCNANAFKAYDALGLSFDGIRNLSSTSMIDGLKRDTISRVLSDA